MLVNEVQAGNAAAIHILTSNIIPPKYVVNNRLYLPFYKLALVNAYTANFMMFFETSNRNKCKYGINEWTRCNYQTILTSILAPFFSSYFEFSIDANSD